MFKLESYITPIIMGYLDKYVKLRQEDFRLSLWGGDAVLSNLDLRLDELEKIIQLPVMFQSGHIHELRLHVPWTKLGSEPVVVTINTVECIVKVRDTAYDGSSTSHSSEAAAKAALQKAKAKRRQQEEDLPPGYLQSIINRIINNVSFVFNNLILKFVEDDIVLSVNIKSAECYSVDRDWNRAFIDLVPEDLALRRVINFADLTVCLDKTNASGHIESYQEPLAYRCAVTCRLHMSYDSVTAKFPKATRFNVYCDVLNLSLTDTQLPMFVRLLELCVAMYYGYLDIPSAAENAPTTASTSPLSSTMVEKSKSLEGMSSTDPDDEGMDEFGNEGWASWAWSMVPQILPSGEEEEDEGGGKMRRGRQQPLILSIGFYVHQTNIIFKLTERAKDGSELPHKKIHFHPFMTMTTEGASVEVLIQGLTFCDVQSGLTACRIFTNGNCICGVSDEDVVRCNTLLKAGESLSQKMKITYLSNSLFDPVSFENQGHPVPYILDREVHLQTYTEQYGLTKFGAFWQDYLYTFEKPDKTRGGGAGSTSSETDQMTDGIFDREFSTLRFLSGDLHVVVSSTLHHRLSKFINCMWDHEYEPYGAGKGLYGEMDERPKPTEDQILSLEEFIPTQLIHLALINPTLTVILSEHPECNVAKKLYRCRHRKKDSKKSEVVQSKDLAAIVISASRFDLQVTKPMYPARLIRLVSAIAGPSSNLLHHCHKHTQIKLFSLQAGLQRTSANGSVTRPITLVPPCSFALYFRYLLLPKLWTNSALPVSEWMFEIPNASVNVNKASVIMLSQIVSSWVTPKAALLKADWLEDSLLDDLFPVSGESTKQAYPLLELNLCGLEFKSCSSTLVDACTASLSSIQVVLYTPGVGGKMSVVPILYGPSNTSQLTKSDFFARKDITSERFTSDYITATLQRPKNTTVREAPAMALVDCQGVAVWFDPGLAGWFHYCPQPRPSAPGDHQQQQTQQQTQVTLDLTLAHMTSPLNAVSQASVHSTSSPSRTGGASRPLTSTLTPRTKSHPVHPPKDGGITSGHQGKTLGETFADYFPLVRALHLQVDMKPSVLFLPKTGLPTTVESCEDLVTAVQQAFVNGRLSSTLVVSLPGVVVASTMAKPINVLQDLPIRDAQGSLIGERLPWTIRLTHTCVYSLIPGQSKPMFLMHPVDVVSTLAVNSTYNPPTSEQISSLALCLHLDVAPIKMDLSSAQLNLLSVTSSQMSSLMEHVSSLSQQCLKMFAGPKPAPISTTCSPRDQTSLRRSTSSSNHRLHTSTQSVQSGDITDQVVTDISEDTSHDSSPLHESIINNEDETGTKLSLWLQLMLPKVGFTIYHTCPQTRKESGVSLTLEELDLCLDSQSVYSKVKLNLSSFSVQHSWKRSNGLWNWNDLDGTMVSCSHQLPRHLRTISNKLWVSDTTTPVSFSQNQDAVSRDKKHVLSVTLTHALCKNVKKRLKKANVELPSVNESDTLTADLGSEFRNNNDDGLVSRCDSNFFYFHDYLSEICLKTRPVDMVMKAAVVDVLTGFLAGLNPKERKMSLSQSPSKRLMFPVPESEPISFSSSSKNNSDNNSSFVVQNLPLIYADIGMLRLFVPLSDQSGHTPQASCDKVTSTTWSSSLSSSSHPSKLQASSLLSSSSSLPKTRTTVNVIERNTKGGILRYDNQTQISHSKIQNRDSSNVVDSPRSDELTDVFVRTPGPTNVTSGLSSHQNSQTTCSSTNTTTTARTTTNKTPSTEGLSGCDVDEKVKSGVISTLDHTMVVIQISGLNVQPHADNPLPRTALEKGVYQQALQSGHAHQPGSSLEDRQYQIEVRGLSIATGCWNHVMREAKQTVTQRSPTGSMVQIPALEWNTFLLDGPGHERKEILLAPLASGFDVTLVMAPPIHCTPKHADQTYLICGMTTELNVTSDLDLYISNGQVELLSHLATQLSHQLDPNQTQSSSSSSTLSMMSSSSSSASSSPVSSHHQHHHHTTSSLVTPDQAGHYHHHHIPGGDSGVESDVSTVTLDHGNRFTVGDGINRKPTIANTAVVATNNTTNLIAPESKGKRVVPPNIDQPCVYGNSTKIDRNAQNGGQFENRNGEKEEDRKRTKEEKATSSSLSSPSSCLSSFVFDLLVTAGRISCTVYSHKILEDKITQELPSFRDGRSSQRVRHRSCVTPATPTTSLSVKPCRDNLEHWLGSNRYHTSNPHQPMELVEEEENSSDNEPFTEFNFMKQTSVESLQKTIVSGSVCVQPFVYVYMTQPHCIVARHGLSGQQSSKLELSCYDVLVKGASDNHLTPAEEYHQIPDCADFNLHWLETRAGIPHPYTGIPPSLVTIRMLSGDGQPATASIQLERPLRVKLSQLAIDQMVSFVQGIADVLPETSTASSDAAATATTTTTTTSGIATSSTTSSTASSLPKKKKGGGVVDTQNYDYVEDGVQGIGVLSKVDEFKLSTCQVVIVMETEEAEGERAAGAVVSVECLNVDLNLDKSESDKYPSLEAAVHIKDGLVKLNYEKKSTPLIGPLTFNSLMTLTWTPVSANRAKSKVFFTAETGLILLRVGQEHVFCLTQLLTRLTHLYQTLLRKTSSETTAPVDDADPIKTDQHQSKEWTSSVPKPLYIYDQSHDDLRRGGFEYLTIPDRVLYDPSPNEIIFSKEYNNNGYMCWCYPQPRVITTIHLTPVPFGLSSTDTSPNSGSDSPANVQCLLQYHDELDDRFITYAQFQLSESEAVTVQVCDIKPSNAAGLVMANKWKVVLLHGTDHSRDAAVLPVSLAACMCVDSAFIPSLIPSMEALITIPAVDIRLCHHLDYNGSELPAKLKRFQVVNDLVEEQEFAIVHINDVRVSARHFLGSDSRTTMKMSTKTSVDVMDYSCLAMKTVLDPVTLSGVASLINNGKKQEMEAQMILDSLSVRVGKNVVHALNMALAAWTSFNPSRSGPSLIFPHYVICNDTTSVIRFGQAGTDENICLRCREMYAYSWRSFNVAQLLHLCMDQPTWRWTQPFPIDNQGVWVRTVQTKDQDYAVIVKVSKLSSVQIQVTITGQVLVSNQLSMPMAVRFGVMDNERDMSGPTNHPQYVMPPSSTLPSICRTNLLDRPIQLRLAFRSTVWSHEIYMTGDRMKESHMVKIPLSGDDSAAYFHIWCRIFCQHFQGKPQKLVMLTPLYVVRTHLPQPLFICLDSPKVKDNQELLVKSRGRDFQLHLQGGDITHSMAFRLGPGMQKSSPPVILSSGLLGQLEREQAGPVDIEQLTSIQTDTSHLSWPYLKMDDGDGSWIKGLGNQQNNGTTQGQIQTFVPNNLELDPNSDLQDQLDLDTRQPSIDLSVQLSEYIPGCETLLVDVTPACLVTNVTQFSVVIGEVLENGQRVEGGKKEGQVEDGETDQKRLDGEKMEAMVERKWILNSGQTLSPPLPKEQFSMAVMHQGKITPSKSIPLSDQPMDYKRYNEDIGRVLFVDGYVQSSFVLQSSTESNLAEAVFLTLTSDLQNGIRTICIRETFCISNLHSSALTTKLLAVSKKTPRGSVAMAKTAAVTLTLEGQGQRDKEVIPTPRWSVLQDTNGQDGDVLIQQNSVVFYVAFRLGKESDEGSSHHLWSVPIRVVSAKDSVRYTTSLPRVQTFTNGKGGESKHVCEVTTTQAVCVTTHYKRGVTQLVVMEDEGPVIVVENLCPFGLNFGQACDQLRADEVTIQEQLELVNDLPSVPAGGWCHYSPPAINTRFGSTDTINMPRIHLRATQKPSPWSSPIQLSGIDAFVRLEDFCDLKVMIEVVGMITHLVIRPVSRAEITAKEIRTRLKDGEFENQQRGVNLKLNSPNDSTAKDTLDALGTTTSEMKIEDNKNPYSSSFDIMERFSERDEIKSKYRNRRAFNLTVGVLAECATFRLQDETYPVDAVDILAVHLKDFYLASFPISRNPSEIVSQNCVALSVGYMQLDNQLCGSGSFDFPVVFLPQEHMNSSSTSGSVSKNQSRKGSYPYHHSASLSSSSSSISVSQLSVIESLAFLRSKSMIHAQMVNLTDALWGQSVIDHVDISIQPCSLYIDDSFVYRLIEEFESFSPSKLSIAPNSIKSTEGLSIYSKLPRKVLCNACELGRPVRIKTLSIHQIRMLLSVHASLKLFLASDHTPLNLAKFERVSVFSDPNRLIHAIAMHYASAAIFRAGIVVGSLEILGNPTGLVRSIGAGVSDLISLPYSGLTRGPGAFIGGVTKGLGSFFRNVSAGMITSMTNFASSMSRNMDRLSFDESHLERQEENRRNRPNGISQGVVQGLTGFGLSLLGAVAGLADQPIRGLVQSSSSPSDQRSSSATSAASGLVAGVGKGLVGVLTKPIGGAAELVSQTGQGILQGTGLGHMPSRLEPPTSSYTTSQGQQLAIWSSNFKYTIKVLLSLPSPILFSYPAVTFDILGAEVKVVLVLTSDLLVIINVEEDAQQQTLSLSELEWRCSDQYDGEYEESNSEDGNTKQSGEGVGQEEGDEEVKGEGDDDNRDVLDGRSREWSKEDHERLATFTLVWTDHFYNTTSLEHRQDASKERIAAFIDATQNLTRCYIPPPINASTGEILAEPPYRTVGADNQSEVGIASDQSQPGLPLIRSLSESSQSEERAKVKVKSAATKTAASRGDAPPEYRFKMDADWMRVFVTVFETAKHRLQGRGFAV